MTINIIYIVLGLSLLVFGADRLVAGASKLAASFNVPSLLIGLTIVSFGTSAPELAVSVQSAVAGQGSLAVANVLGSNTFNILIYIGYISADSAAGGVTSIGKKRYSYASDRLFYCCCVGLGW
ncbi:hypothetical protein CTT31_07490 [Pseudoalteromonas maricaloris]|uniref:hypothetical protein n=1 Tax=Pseudoalteromonas maricaloris TaxID=184924 RepID=UPI0021AD5CFA|nr:hypothetical protein [Pseudoalteromonas flavipulchra]USE68960.1 hypothetical protein CTT31_07490 [Pseudoalteromonas flavipulchra]